MLTQDEKKTGFWPQIGLPEVQLLDRTGKQRLRFSIKLGARVDLEGILGNCSKGRGRGREFSLKGVSFEIEENSWKWLFFVLPVKRIHQFPGQILFRADLG